jgi:hypothetical protein
MSRRTLTLALLFVVACASACGGGGAQQSANDDRPKLTPDSVREDINNEWVRVPAADGKSEVINWGFAREEPKQIDILDQKIEGDTATFLINMQTHTLPRARTPRSFSGQLRLHYELQSGLVFRKWEIVQIENVSFKYVNEPKPADNSNTNATNTNATNANNANAKTNANDKFGANDKPKANEDAPTRPKS